MTTDTTTSTDTTDSVVAASDPASAAQATVDAYLAVWNINDDADRAAAAAECLGPDLWYRDPLLEADGLDAFVATVGAVQSQYPTFVMSRTSELDCHHDVVRFTWAFGEPGAEPAIAGVDMAKFDATDKLHRIVGFMPADGPAATAATAGR